MNYQLLRLKEIKMCLFADAAEKEAYLARHNGKEYVTVWKIVASFDDREYLTPMIRKKS